PLETRAAAGEGEAAVPDLQGPEPEASRVEVRVEVDDDLHLADRRGGRRVVLELDGERERLAGRDVPAGVGRERPGDRRQPRRLAGAGEEPAEVRPGKRRVVLRV